MRVEMANKLAGQQLPPTKQAREKEKKMRNLMSFIKEEEGMGTVEVVLIIVVLIALVAIFKKSIVATANTILQKVTDEANKI